MPIELQLGTARNEIPNDKLCGEQEITRKEAIKDEQIPVNFSPKFKFSFFRVWLVGMEEERPEGDMERAVEWIWVGCTSIFLLG